MGIKSRQAGEITITQGTTGASVGISSVDTSKTEVEFLGSSTNISSGVGPATQKARIRLQSATVVAADLEGGVPGNGESLTVNYQVTEWE